MRFDGILGSPTAHLKHPALQRALQRGLAAVHLKMST